MLKSKDLTFSYDGKKKLQFPDIECATGEHWLLLGASGSGKTTFLHLLGGLLQPSAGEVNIVGTSTRTLSKAQLDAFRGKHIGIVFQQSHFVQSLNVLENITIAQYLANRPTDPKKAMQLLENLNIAHKAKAHPNDLSQGEQQRAAIARALINNPSVVLADEPTAALDDANALEVIEMLENQTKTHKATLLVVTHDARLKARFRQTIAL